MTDYTEDLKSIKASSKILNEVESEAATVIQAADDFLASCSTGLPSRVFMYGASAECKNIAGAVVCPWALVYDRIDGRFRIGVAQYIPKKEGENEFRPSLVDVKPWSKCRRETRIDAVEKLPELIRQIASRTSEAIEKLTAAKNESAKLLDSLRAASND